MRVEWTSRGLDRLADIYVAATPADRDDIEATTRRINAALAVDPSVLGESRSGGWRVWFEYPLMVLFCIFPAQQVVVVTHVARLRRRSP